MVGELIADRYELRKLVGSGGMSVVYRAHDRSLERTVALKVLHQRHVEDESAVARFRREAETAGSLSHPNVVTVIDRGQHRGRPYIVFEYVEGENLKQHLAREGPLDPRRALELALQIAAALSFAHERGLVHRDVKPQNVLLNGDGDAKVTDFGIARSLDVRKGMTDSGAVLGTSDYLSPEQARGDRVDERTDVYSLGIVLWELLVGEPPFPGENFVAVALRHLNEPPPSVRARRPEISPRLDAALNRALAKDAKDRFPTMSAFAGELEGCLSELGDEQTLDLTPPSRARRPRRTRRRAWPLVVLVAGLLTIGGAVAGFLALRGGSGTGTAQATHVAVVGVRAYDPDGDGREHDDAASLATDGDRATYWRTERYHSPLSALGKSGVGLVLDAGAVVHVGNVDVVSDTPGFVAEIRAGESPAGPFRRVSNSQTVQGDATFQLHDATARYYLLWITAVPASGLAHVNEVTAAQ